MSAPLIAINAAHGGHDPGAVGLNGTREKDVCLAVAMMAAPLIVSLGHDVLQLRLEDVFVPLAARSRRANEAGATIFLSIHCNAAENRAANGYETWAFSPTSIGATLAGYVHPVMAKTLGIRDRGIKFGNIYAPLRDTHMPAALIELAFISNPTEEALLADEAWQRMAAEAISMSVKAAIP